MIETWSNSRKLDLLTCTTDQELLQVFPGHKLESLKRRQREFKKEKRFDPDRLFDTYEKRETVKVSGLKDNTKILITSDYQLPFADWKTVKAVEDFMADFQPDIHVYNGDIMDCYSISTFTKNPTSKINLSEEFEMCRNLLDRHKRISPDTKVYFIAGNHEQRLIREIIHNSPELYGLKGDEEDEIISIPSLLGLPKRNVTYINYRSMLDIEGFIILHGYTSKANTAKFMYQRFLSSGCVGHTHDLSSYHVTGVNGSHGFYTIGCLCSLEPDWTVDPVPDWQQGFMYAVVMNNKLHPKLVHIYEDGFYAEGKFYKR